MQALFSSFPTAWVTSGTATVDQAPDRGAATEEEVAEEELMPAAAIERLIILMAMVMDLMGGGIVGQLVLECFFSAWA